MPAKPPRSSNSSSEDMFLVRSILKEKDRSKVNLVYILPNTSGGEDKYILSIEVHGTASKDLIRYCYCMGIEYIRVKRKII